MKSVLVCSCLFLLCQMTSAWVPLGRNYHFDSFHPSTPEPDGLAGSGSLDIFNTSEDLTGNGSVQELPREDSSVSTTQNSSLSTTQNSPVSTTQNSSVSTTQNSSESTTGSQPSTHSTTASSPNATLLVVNESQSTQNSSVAYNGAIQDSGTFNTTVPPSNDTEEEGVARGKPSTTESSTITTPQPQNIYQKAWTLVNDTYTLSILLPVTAGVVFATSIILTIACCRCLRRCCIRRRLRKKVLPDSVKNLRPSDRARLLAESSDDEF